MIKVSHEMPLALLKDGTEVASNDYFYALVHLFDDHDDYYDYVVKQLRDGRDVILDNSAYELHGKPFNTEGFVGWIRALEIDTNKETLNKYLTYIIPDVFDMREETFDIARSFLEQYDDLPGKAMVVCQGKSLMELTKIFQDFTELPKVAKIGVNFMSKAYTTFASNTPKLQAYDVWRQRTAGRKYFIEHLYHSGLLGIKPVHLLGAAEPGEFRYYTEEHPILSSFIHSMDTSAPIIQGMFSEELSPVDLGKATKRPEKLAEHLLDGITEEVKQRIIYNMRVFRSYNEL
jgi:hypothetical protein